MLDTIIMLVLFTLMFAVGLSFFLFGGFILFQSILMILGVLGVI